MNHKLSRLFGSSIVEDGVFQCHDGNGIVVDGHQPDSFRMWETPSDPSRKLLFGDSFYLTKSAQSRFVSVGQSAGTVGGGAQAMMISKWNFNMEQQNILLLEYLYTCGIYLVTSMHSTADTRRGKGGKKQDVDFNTIATSNAATADTRATMPPFR